MTLKESLIASRAVIADPARWTKGASAKTAFGTPTPPADEGAVCFCAYGAVTRATMYEPDSGLWLQTTDALDDIADARGFGTAPSLNDDRDTTHADVLAMFDAAIEAAPA